MNMCPSPWPNFPVFGQHVPFINLTCAVFVKITIFARNLVDEMSKRRHSSDSMSSREFTNTFVDYKDEELVDKHGKVSCVFKVVLTHSCHSHCTGYDPRPRDHDSLCQLLLLLLLMDICNSFCVPNSCPYDVQLLLSMINLQSLLKERTSV